MLAIFLMAAGLLVFPLGAHARNSPSMRRRAALAKLERSDWKRPFLENFWLLSYAATPFIFLSFLSAIYFQGAGNGWAALFCWSACLLFTLALIWLSVLPPYTVVKAWREARDARARRKQR
jgi:hypothetical protein